jgi:hypothetical protein
MATCNEWHMKLGASGLPADEGKCSVPMWRGGMPAGFCDDPAFGEPLPKPKWWPKDDQVYVPFLACPGHGGPERPPRIATPPERATPDLEPGK